MGTFSENTALMLLLVLVWVTRVHMEGTTSIPFHPDKFNVARNKLETLEKTNSLEVDFSDGFSADENNNVLYVNPSDYSQPEPDPDNVQKPAAEEPLPAFLETLRNDPESFSDFGSASELYRLLALGPQQSDPAIGFGLNGLFGRVGSGQAKKALDNIDHCPDRPEIGIQYYCMQLEDGLYHDPWNPWCGFIRCSDGVAERICCKKGSWLGMTNLYKANQKEMCRKPLQLKIVNDKCPVPNTLDFCKAAIKVEKMNPPKLKRKIDPAALAKFEFSRIHAKSAPDAPVKPALPPAVAAAQDTSQGTDDSKR